MSIEAHVDVAAFEDLAAGSALQVVVNGVKVALVRIGDDVYAISDTCSHADVSLSQGEVLCDEREIECWKHGSVFSLLTGEALTLPATQPVAVYDATVVDGRILIAPAPRGTAK